jgi:hypothetical protein
MPARHKPWKTSRHTCPRSPEARCLRARIVQRPARDKTGGSVERMTFVVILAIVAFGALVIRYSGGRTVKSTAENQTTTSRDGTTITFSKGIWAAVNHSWTVLSAMAKTDRLRSWLAGLRNPSPCSLMIVEAVGRVGTQRHIRSIAKSINSCVANRFSQNRGSAEIRLDAGQVRSNAY